MKAPGPTRWRADGPYVPTISSKAGLLPESRLFLQTYTRLREVRSTGAELVDRVLPQRSRSTRRTIVRFIQSRLTSWNPPEWALDDLATFAQADDGSSLESALLLHVARQDLLLYDVIQELVWPKWRDGDLAIGRTDVQRFFDRATEGHPEIERWTLQTRAKLASNLLTILRDYGLLTRMARKTIVEPVVPPAVARHLVRLLEAEGIDRGELATHSDWRLWLWNEERAAAVVQAATAVSAEA